MWVRCQVGPLRLSLYTRILPSSHPTGFSLNSCLCVLKVLEDEKLADNAEKLGKILRREMSTLDMDKRVVKDVRGKGLLNALEIDERSGWCWYWFILGLYSQFQVACHIVEKRRATLSNQIRCTQWLFGIACIWLASWILLFHNGIATRNRLCVIRRY